MASILEYQGNYRVDLPMPSTSGKWTTWGKSENLPLSHVATRSARTTSKIKTTATQDRYIYEFKHVYGCSCAITSSANEQYHLMIINIFDFSFVIMDFNRSKTTIIDLDCPTSILFFDIL